MPDLPIVVMLSPREVELLRRILRVEWFQGTIEERQHLINKLTTPPPTLDHVNIRDAHVAA